MAKKEARARRGRRFRGLPSLLDAFALPLRMTPAETNITKFTAHLEPEPSENARAKAVVGEGWSEGETSIERSALVAYQYGETPHLDFAKLKPTSRKLKNGTICTGEKEALDFLDNWGPLRQSDYLPVEGYWIDQEGQVRDTPDGKIKPWQGPAPGLQPILNEPLRFRTSLEEFWGEQKKFKELVSIWCEVSAGNSDWKKVNFLIERMNPVLRDVRPYVTSGGTEEAERPVAGLRGRNDLLTSLYFCLWSDIAQNRPTRRCKNEFCQRFFRPSRERQLYHNQICLRRQLQREYMRAKRQKPKRRKTKARR